MHAPPRELEGILQQLLCRIELIHEYVLSRRDYGEIDAAARATAEPHLQELFNAFSRAHGAWRHGEGRDAAWEPVCAAMKSLLRTTLYRDYWQSHRSEFEDEFRSRVDDLLS